MQTVPLLNESLWNTYTKQINWCVSSPLCFDGIQGKNSVEISHTGIHIGVYVEICLMLLFSFPFTLSDRSCPRHLRMSPQACLQISSPCLRTWKFYVICPAFQCFQVLPLPGWLPGSPNFPSAERSLSFECLSPILLVPRRRYLLTSFFFIMYKKYSIFTN